MISNLCICIVMEPDLVFSHNLSIRDPQENKHKTLTFRHSYQHPAEQQAVGEADSVSHGFYPEQSLPRSQHGFKGESVSHPQPDSGNCICIVDHRDRGLRCEGKKSARKFQTVFINQNLLVMTAKPHSSVLGVRLWTTTPS